MLIWYLSVVHSLMGDTDLEELRGVLWRLSVERRTRELIWGDGQRSEVFLFFFFLAIAFHLLFLTVFLLTRACVAERWERRFNVCEELAFRARCSPHERISPFPWFPLISPCLLTSSDLWSACTSSLEKAKDLKLAVLDVAGWRCRKKKRKIK